MSDYVTFVAECIELAMAGAGCVLLWRHVLSPAARTRPQLPALAPWEARPVEFLTFLFFVISGGFLISLVGSMVAKPLGLSGDTAMVFNGAAAQLGMLAGIALYRSASRRAEPATTAPPNFLLAGGATFLMALPLVLASAKVWALTREAAGLPAEKQDLIDLFMRTTSPGLLTAMILLAVVVAPVTEELIFRAGIFRYLRTRLPRPLGFLLPALIFAALHVQWPTLGNLASFAPLTVLALIFSAAYERTGLIATTMVAHALFNLNTVVLIFAGVSE